ncbi:TrmH family RNA methyltransferase [Holophaga foetida]|uniref:TrmH family RNA methyltransferase n=1 Tax=Holophaga foetida TaxID=35839 RepID=UPI0002475385|nr:RNA methyltransferase [Holophaga foetida]
MSDPEFLPYHQLHGAKTALHPEVGPCFICEGRFLVESALEAGREGRLRVISLLCQESLEPEFAPRLPEGTRLLTATKAELSELLGFTFHRGVLCCVAVPPEPCENAILEASRLVVLPHVDNVENLGLILRSAAALGMDAVVAGRGPSPFERRSLRVSMGAAWKLPVIQREDPGPLLEAWRAAAPDSEIVGAALSPTALDARLWQPARRSALVLGPEAYGLDEDWLQRCDQTIAIPMAKGMDSLNVAAAGAILMFKMMG